MMPDTLHEPAEAPVPGRRRLILMRHGEVRYVDDSGRPVHPKTVALTGRGAAQARAARELLADQGVDRLLVSPKDRCRQTAALATEGLGLAPRDEAELTEIRSGNALRLPEPAFDAAFTYGFEGAAAPGARFCDGEPFAAFRDRVVGVVERLLAEPGWSCALVVSHDGTNRVLLSWAVGAGLAAAGAFDQDMGCLNVLDLDVAEGRIVRATLRAVNVTPIDPLKAGRRLTSMERLAADLRPWCADGAARR